MSCMNGWSGTSISRASSDILPACRCSREVACRVLVDKAQVARHPAVVGETLRLRCGSCGCLFLWVDARSDVLPSLRDLELYTLRAHLPETPWSDFGISNSPSP
jgi:hypothetical protein